jgi:hypothetical protein
MTAPIKLVRLDAARQPTDIPRKQAISTRFVKNVKKTTVLPKNRMQASSAKRTTKLIRKSLALALDRVPAGVAVGASESVRVMHPPSRGHLVDVY